jgi:hypothetical protein
MHSLDDLTNGVSSPIFLNFQLKPLSLEFLLHMLVLHNVV